MGVAAADGGGVQLRGQGLQLPAGVRIRLDDQAIGAGVRYHGHSVGGRVFILALTRAQLVEQLGQLRRRGMVQDHQFHFAGARRTVQALDDAGQALHIGGPVGKDQRGGLGIRREMAVGGQQGAQNWHQALRENMIQVDDSGDQVLRVQAAWACRRAPGGQAAGSPLGGRDDLDDARGFHGGIAIDFQHGLEHPVGLVFRQRLGGHHGHLALHRRVHQEILAGELSHRLDNGAKIGVFKIEVDRLRPGRRRQRQRQKQKQAKRAHRQLLYGKIKRDLAAPAQEIQTHRLSRSEGVVGGQGLLDVAH